MAYTFEIAGGQIDGARDYQEDAFLITHLGDKNGGSMVIVADGMGGHAAGNVASNLAVQAFNRNVSANFPSDNLPATLRESARKANTSIAETVRETPALKGMGCTLVCAIFSDKHMRWVSVGDSNLYLLRNGELKKKNADHSYGGYLDRMAAEGKVVDADTGFSRNMLMSALTGEEIPDVDCPETPLELAPGDRIVVASDGLDTLADEKLVAISAASQTAKQCVDNLLKGVQAEKIPRQDNTTVVVVDVLAAARASVAPAAATEQVTIVDDQEDRTQPKTARGQQAASAAGAAPAARRGASPVLGITAVVLALAGAAAYFVLSGQSGSGTEPAPEPVAQSADPSAQPAAEPAPATQTPPAEEPAATPAAEPATEPDVPAVAVAPESTATGTFRDGPGPEMTWIPAGEFTMGATQMAAEPDEKPPHPVRIGKLAISVREVTFAEYERFAPVTQARLAAQQGVDKTQMPAVFVSWDDAVRYTRWLSRQTGKKYRLASEAEWEYAARAGTGSQYWWGQSVGTGNAHCFGCNSGLDPRRPTRVGSFKPNAFGLYDTAGNVAEWVHDCYHPSYEGAPADGSVWEGGDCANRIVRGGSFQSVAKSVRSSARDKARSNIANDTTGIRVVREP
ncbi:MAG: SUMF1/EgtB/PvdO family nonheme iron enzyme [Gammaproteobacteria bacterium]